MLKVDIRVGYTGRPLQRGESWYDERLQLIQDEGQDPHDFLDEVIENLSNAVSQVAEDNEDE